MLTDFILKISEITGEYCSHLTSDTRPLYLLGVMSFNKNKDINDARGLRGFLSLITTHKIMDDTMTIKAKKVHYLIVYCFSCIERNENATSEQVANLYRFPS